MSSGRTVGQAKSALSMDLPYLLLPTAHPSWLPASDFSRL